MTRLLITFSQSYNIMALIAARWVQAMSDKKKIMSTPKRATLPDTFFFLQFYKFSILIWMHYLLELCEIVLDSEFEYMRSVQIVTFTKQLVSKSRFYRVKTVISSVKPGRTILCIQIYMWSTFSDFDIDFPTLRTE